MEHVAVRPVDPAELPELVEQAVAIADGAELTDADRAALLPQIFGALTARAIFPQMPSVLADPRALRGLIGGG